MCKFPALLSGCAALLLSLAAPSFAVDNTTSALGTNFWFFGDNQAIWPFVDFFKQSRPFWSATGSSWSDNRALALDTNGYPAFLQSGQYAATLLFWDAQGPIPAGDWVALWDGDGDISIDNTAATVASGGANRLVVTMRAGADPRLRLLITRTNAANHLRNIRFIAPGFESTYQTQVFHPAFLDKLSPFRVLRFMDWMAANSNPQVNWTDRNTPNSQTYANDHGVCIERLVELCNRLNCDGWFCLPVRGTDDCFRQYATYIRDHLKTNCKAYFEYGNEVWNGGVQHGVAYVESLGVSMGFASGWTAQHHGWAKRMTDMLTIVEQVYAGKMNQCVRVAATQVGNTGVADGILNYYNGKSHADVLAVAPYFNTGGATGSDDQIIAALASQVSQIGTWIQGDLSIAKSDNLRLVCYESGLDIWNLSDAQKTSVRFDPRMKAIYKTYLDGWKSGGGTLIIQYTFCDPYWGLMREMDDSLSRAPMYAAALEWVAANPRWWTEDRATRIVPFLGQPTAAPEMMHQAIFRLDGRLVNAFPWILSKENPVTLPAGAYYQAGDRNKPPRIIVR